MIHLSVFSFAFFGTWALFIAGSVGYHLGRVRQYHREGERVAGLPRHYDRPHLRDGSLVLGAAAGFWAALLVAFIAIGLKALLG